MTEQELIARLRGRSQFCKDRGEVKSPDLMNEAADRFEELVKEKTALNNLFNATYNKHVAEIIAVEAKLTKAVEALREFAKQKAAVEMDDHEYDQADFEGAYGQFIFKARTVMAELEGEPLGAEFQAVWDNNKGKWYEE